MANWALHFIFSRIEGYDTSLWRMAITIYILYLTIVILYLTIILRQMYNNLTMNKFLLSRNIRVNFNLIPRTVVYLHLSYSIHFKHSGNYINGVLSNLLINNLYITLYIWSTYKSIRICISTKRIATGFVYGLFNRLYM
jgi:ammonia channel protein AmtB